MTTTNAKTQFLKLVYNSSYRYISQCTLIYWTVCIIFVSNSFLFVTALYSDNIGSNPYIVKYDKLNYDPQHVNKLLIRKRRSAIDSATMPNENTHDSFLLKFFSHGRQFNLKLRPASRNNFAHNFVEINSHHTKMDINKVVSFYEGHLLDEPDSSHVTGTIIDGIFYGTISSKKHGKYFIESSRRYNHTLDSHSIVYNENDINRANIRLRSRRSVVDDDDHDVKKPDHAHLEDEHDLTCASAKKNVKEWMQKEQQDLYNERVRVEGYDPYSYTEIPDEPYYKYSKEANEKYFKEVNRRKKRETRESERVKFPGERTICNLYLRVDPQLHTEIFNNEGNKDPDKTTAFLLFYLNKHVEALNTIYNGLPFFDANKEKYLVGIQFMIYRTKIITEEQCRNKTVLTAEELKLCEPYLDVSTFLNYVSLDNFTDYCLAYTFTARDFTDGTLGLAWVAKLSGSVGGVCEKRQTLQGIAKSLNSGIVTVVNYQARVPEAVSQITFAHEVGHNFGSEHDPDDSLCSPGPTKGGNYIMYRRATTGTDANNRNFSECSRDQMGPILHALVQGSKFCFKQYNGSLCGNGIVEEGEECDCGYGTDCKETCCVDASQEVNKCKLKPGKACSPSQGPCCDNMCSFASADTICMHSNECLKNVFCSGRNATCPHNNPTFFKPDKTECNSGTQVCKSGVCSGSICEKYEMQQCFLEGNLKDKKQDKAVLCHLACIGEKTNNLCRDSFEIPEMIQPNATKGLILKPGSPCVGTLGYCDIFSKCRAVDAEGPLARLKNILLNPETLLTIRDWITTYWWAALLIGIGLIIFMAVFIKVCSVHTPSSNPRKPPALKISETLRRPIKKLPHIPHPHWHLHHGGGHQQQPTSTASAAAASTQNEITGNKRHKKSSSSNSRDHNSHHNHRHKTSEVTGAPSSSSKHVSKVHKSSSSNNETASGHHHRKPVSGVKPGKRHRDALASSANGDSKEVRHEPRHSGRKYMFTSKRHKSNEPIHYYNNNHPLHPIPHSSHDHHTSSARKNHERSHRSHSKSAEQTQASHNYDRRHHHHNHRYEAKKHKAKSKSHSPSSNEQSDFITKLPSTSKELRLKARKRSSTESSSVDA